MVRVVNVSEAHVHLHYSVRRFRDHLVRHIEQSHRFLVNPGSKAESKGVREGDFITSINGQSTKCLTNSESHALLRTVKESLLLGLNEDKNSSPRRRSREIKSVTEVAEEKEKSETTSLSKGSKKLSASQRRHQRRSRFKHRIKELFGFKSKSDTKSDSEEWEIIDGYTKDLETKSVISYSSEQGKTIVRSLSEPTDPEKIYENFDFKNKEIIETGKFYHRQIDELTFQTELNEPMAITTEPSVEEMGREEFRKNEVNRAEIPLVEVSKPKITQSSLGLFIPESEEEVRYSANGITISQNTPYKAMVNLDNFKNEQILEKSINFENIYSDQIEKKGRSPGTVEVFLCSEGADEVELAETLHYLPPDEKVEVCNAIVMVEGSDCSAVSMNAPIIKINEEDHKGNGSINKTPNPDYEPVEVNSSVIIYPPYNSTISYYFPQRRYLEVISEENSDVSDGEKPWESSEQIRKNNEVDSIPQDWYGSQEGIDTSWRDGKSIEEMSDVPIFSDSHSDSDLLSDETKATVKKEKVAISMGEKNKVKFTETDDSSKGNSVDSNGKTSTDMEPNPAKPEPRVTSIPPSGKEKHLVGSSRKVYKISSPSTSQVSRRNMKHVPSVSVVKNVISSYYNNSVPEKVTLNDKVRKVNNTTRIELNTSVVRPATEKDVELVYIDSSDSEAVSSVSNLSLSNRTSFSVDKDEVEVTEEISTGDQEASSNIDSKHNEAPDESAIIEEVISNLQQTTEEISNMMIESTVKSYKKHRKQLPPLPTNLSNESKTLYNISHIVSPKLPRKKFNFNKNSKSKRRFSYPFSGFDVSKVSDNLDNVLSNVVNEATAIRNEKLWETKVLDSNDKCFIANEVPNQLHISETVTSEPSQKLQNVASQTDLPFVAVNNHALFLGSGEDVGKSTESIYFDFSDVSVSTDSYHLPDVTHDNEYRNPHGESVFVVSAPSPKFLPKSPAEVSEIFDLHKKFIARRGYHESTLAKVNTVAEPDLIALSKCTGRDAYSDTPELLAQAANLLALQKYHESRQKKMMQVQAHEAEKREKNHSKLLPEVKNDSQFTQEAEISLKQNIQVENEIESPNQSSCVKVTLKVETKKSDVDENETVGKSRLLELFQKLDSQSSNSECNMPEPCAHQLVLGSPSVSDKVRVDTKVLEKRDSNERVDGNFHDKEAGEMSEISSQASEVRYQVEEGTEETMSLASEVSSKPEVIISRGGSETQSRSAVANPQHRMYEEYMGKIAELTERRNLKVIKISNRPNSVSVPSDIQPLESEFMIKLRERNEKLGIATEDDTKVEEGMEPDLNVDNLPKHLQELMEITEECGDIVGKDGLLVEIDEALSPERKGFLTAKGVWSPVQTPEAERKKFDFSKEIREEKEREKRKVEEEEKKEPQPPVWTPRSAGASPTLDRKYRAVNFQSPPPTRKELKTQIDSPELPKELPVEGEESKLRLVSSSSENSSLSSALRLPAAQNPTITLLQKAREGQIPRGAQYLEEEPSYGGPLEPNDIIYAVKRERFTEDGSKKIVDLGPRKIEGIGPTTKEGVPIVLRSEVKEDNQQRWYKRMYDSLHKAGHDEDFVTVKYRTKRRGYPYIYSGGYVSEPERIGYDSDASLSKYATLDRRKIRNKENDFTTSTMPRNRYAPGVKYAATIYKNQPGRIEDYEPGNSSIAEKEKKQWWDEVMDIFDGELNEQARNNQLSTSISGKPFTYSLKDTGYESDSTLVFKRRENQMSSQLLSPAEQKMAYKVIQKGGEVPLQGLRKSVPERPKENSEIEYFPLSPTLTRIRVHKKSPKPKEKVYYPVSDDSVYSSVKQSHRSIVPAPPRRHSSRYNSTLKLYTQVGTASPDMKPDYFKDKLVTNLPVKEGIDVKIEKIPSKIKNTIVKYEQSKVQYGVIRPKKELLRKSPELKAPAEVKKALKETKTQPGTVVKSSTTLYSSARNKKTKEDKSLRVTVAISAKGKELLTSSSSGSSKSDFRKSPVLSKSVIKSKNPVESKFVSPGPKVLRPSSRSSITSTVISTEQSKKNKKDMPIEQKKKRDKKPEVISKNIDKAKEEDKKKIKKKTENGKKKNGSKKKDKENVPEDGSLEKQQQQMIQLPPSEPPKKQEFFQKLLLREHNNPATPPSCTTLGRTPSILERIKKFSEPPHTCYKSEPSLRNINVYLAQKKPVSESRFRSLDRNTDRDLSPFYGTYEFYDKLDKFDRHNNVWDYSLSYRTTPTYESVKGRSSSEPPHTSPTFSQEKSDNLESISPSTSRSPSCRRIRRSSSRAIETICGVRKVRSKSLNEGDRQSPLGSTSSLSPSQYNDQEDYRSYVLELLHSTKKSEKFKELHKFYSSLERMGELEKTASNTDLRPRLRGEEVIDYDRWKQLRDKEKAEKELTSLYEKLKDDQKEKGFLFQPKEAVRWCGDSGLRHKEKSVEDLRMQYQKMVENISLDKRKELDSTKDIYKPLWRGNSVANLAHSLTTVTGSKRGRPVKESHQALMKPPIKKDKDIGSRLWSSLSMEQVNALKNQLSEIYSTVSNLKHDRIKKMKQNIEDYEINVTDLSRSESPLHVRCNSLVNSGQLYSPFVKKKIAKRQECMKADSISTLPTWKSKPLSENDKRKLSMTLSAEVKERIKKKKHGSLVIPRETLGAVAAIKGTKKFKSPCNSETSPRTCYSLLSDDSVDKSDDKNKDFLLVLTPKDQKDDVRKIVDDWGGKEYARMVQTTSSSSSSASTVIHLGYKEDNKSFGSKLGEFSQSQTDLRQTDDSYEMPQKTLYSSQSFSDLKDLFGEKHGTTYATLPLRSIRKPCFSSTDSLYKSISPDPMKYYRAYLNVVKSGDVRKLKEKFESYDDIYNLRKERSPVQKMFQSDPDLTRDYLSRKVGELSKVIVKGQEVGDVQWLRRKYEPRKVSPIPFKVEDRYMPHINVISKTAALQRRSRTPPVRTEVSRTGNVERLKQQFEKRGMSLLGQMFTSTPEITELRDIAPYLECDWIAHQNPRRSASKRKVRSRPASASPVRQSILKQHDIFANQEFNPEIHRPVYRYQPEPWQPKHWARPTVTFKEPHGNPIPTPPRDSTSRQRIQESPHRYVESEVNIHYRSPVRHEQKVAWPEDELAQRQAEIMRRIYQEQRRTKYLNELHDMYSRRHADNLLPSQKSPIPLNRYDDFPVEVQPPRPRDRTPEPKLVARALYNFVGQTSRELSFRRGDIIYVRRQIDKNWYEGEHNAMVGLFPFNYVEIIPYDGIRTLPKKASEGQARAKFNFQAQTHLELSLVKGELVLLTRRVDENWFEGRIGNRKGIFPVSYVEVLVEPGERATSPTSGSASSKPIVAPASHSVMLNGAKDLGQQHYQPPRPAIYTSSSLPPSSKLNDISLVNQALHIDTQSDPVPYRVLYNYRPQNEDELELKEGDIVYVMEKCDDGWYVGSLHRNGQFGTFPGNYVERIQ